MVTLNFFLSGNGTDPAKLFVTVLTNWKAILPSNLSAQSYYQAKDAQPPQPYIERLVWSIVENRDTVTQVSLWDLDILSQCALKSTEA